MRVSRRSVLQAGLAAGAGMMVAPARVWGEVLRLDESTGAESGPRQRWLMDRNWRFMLGNAADPAKDLEFNGPEDFSKQARGFKFAEVKFDDATWRKLDLPHDWAIELTPVNDPHESSHGARPLGREYPATSVGWYRKMFTLPAGMVGKRVVLEFEGCYRNTQVWVNGCYMGLHESGYSPFSFDVTDFLDYGNGGEGGKNVITVRADATHGDGWFYEGAGIYRHVWLTATDAVHLEPWETIVRTTPKAGGAAEVRFSSVVTNRYTQGATNKAECSVRWEVFEGTTRVASAQAGAKSVGPDAKVMFEGGAEIHGAKLWSPETPVVYRVVATVESAGKVIDREETVTGVRKVEFTVDRGMLLNGKPVKLQGVCNHQDHACVGVAVPDRLQAWRMERMQWMGCNALRTSHNYPAPALIEACDRLGVMVMCETRLFSSSELGRAELTNMITRYRNHPSIVIWSLGNEEFAVQGNDVGERIAFENQQLAHDLDPARKCTIAMNAEWGKGISHVIDVMGMNYNVGLIEGYHKDHPQQPLVGTETASLVTTRGIYMNDAALNWVSAYDDNPPEKHVHWGETAEEWWSIYGGREYLSGGFAWTGFDYRGEPTPYGWPSTSSQFGIMDLCGFAKDEAWYYKTWWTQAPVLHVLPHWNLKEQGFVEGAPVKVVAYSNQESVELLVNGKSLGTKPVPKLGHVEWLDVPFIPGNITVHAMRGGNVMLTETVETAGEPASLRMTADRATIAADGEDVSVVKVEVLDAVGRVMPMANVKLKLTATGAGKVLGMGNGNPNSIELDAAKDGDAFVHMTFNGLAQAIVQSGLTAGEVTLNVESKGLKSASVTVQVQGGKPRMSLG